MNLLGKQAPNFYAEAIVHGCIKKISLDDFAGKYKILFFYPLDFTFVCPTELHALQESLSLFHKRNTEVIAISVDSVYSHLAWLSLTAQQGGIQGINFPLVGDITKSISRSYDVLQEETGIAHRALFLLDQKNVVHAIHMNAAPLGRAVDPLLRLIDALQYVEHNGAACPANWKPGEPAIKTTKEGVVEYFCSNKKGS